MTTTYDVTALPGLVGTELGVSAWTTIDQDRIQRFASATGDEQWLHTDPARAARGPFGRTVAHGLLTLSLLPALAAQAYTFSGAVGRVNYGYERVRFPAPVAAGSRVRDRIVLDAVTALDGAVRVHTTHTVEIDDEGDRPACVARAITHLVLGGAR